MEFENPLVVTLDNKLVYETVDRRRRRHEALRSGAERRARSGQRAPEEHPLPRDGGTAQDRRGVQTPDLRRVRRSAADVRARRWPGSLVSREFLPASGAVRRERAQSDAEPRANLQLPPDDATAPPTPRLRRTSRRCAKQIITSLAKRAYRRPVSAEDVNELLAVLPRRREGRAASREASAARSPAFWRARSSCIAASTSPAGLRPGDTYTINDLELASKLSFFLWNTIPDDELLQLAISGKLERARRARAAGPAHAGRSALR